MSVVVVGSRSVIENSALCVLCITCGCILFRRLLYCAENEEDDVDFDEGKKEGRRRRGGTGSDRDRSLPPLLARVNGQIEVSHHLLHHHTMGLLWSQSGWCYRSCLVIGMGTQLPVSVSVTRVPVRYPGTRVTLNTHLDFLKLWNQRKFDVRISYTPI